MAIGREDLASWVELGYAEIAHRVLRPYTAGLIDETRLSALCEDAYDYEVPLEHVDERRYLMRLDRGPTASFKDFAARMMARWMGVLMQAEGGDLVILTATSGDTGSAVAHAYHGVERVSVVVLFPIKEVSDRQRKQMTTLGGNVTTLSVEGSDHLVIICFQNVLDKSQHGLVIFNYQDLVTHPKLLCQAN